MIKQLIHSAKIEKEIMLKVGLRTVDSHEVEEVDTLPDSGATGLFIDHAWLHQKKITTHKLEHPIEVYNINRSFNRGGSITEEVTLILSYQGHKEHAVFEVCDLGKSNLIIGYTWLHKHNPEIDWETGKVELMRCPRECNVAERRQKGIKKKRKGVGDEKSMKSWKVMIEEEIDAEMQNVVALIMIEKNDQSKLYRSM